MRTSGPANGFAYHVFTREAMIPSRIFPNCVLADIDEDVLEHVEFWCDAPQTTATAAWSVVHDSVHMQKGATATFHPLLLLWR